MSRNTQSNHVSRRSVLKSGVLTSVSGGALLGGSVGVVGAQTRSDEWSTEIICPAHESFLPGDVECGDETAEEDHTLLRGGVSWPDGEVGYHVSETSALSAGIRPSAFQAAGDAAANAWDEHAKTIDLVTGGADITVEFGAWSRPGTILAVTHLAGHGTEIDSADIRLDVRAPWEIFEVGNSDCPGVHDTSAFDVEGVLTHEFGHALGLGHEPSAKEPEDPTDPLLTMYPGAPPGWTAERSPEKGDIGGIERLY